MKQAEADLLKPEGGASVVQLQNAVEFAMALLVKLPKLKPEGMDEDAGVDVLRDAMQDPAKIVERLQANKSFQDALKAIGWLAPPAQVNHRPNKAQAAERAAYAERQKTLEVQDHDEDDSELQRMLGKGGN